MHSEVASIITSECLLTTPCGSSAQSSPCKAKTQFAIMFDERFVTAVNPTSHTKFLTDPRVKGVRPPYDHVLMFAQTTSASVSSATSSLASSGNHGDTSWMSTFSRY